MANGLAAARHWVYAEICPHNKYVSLPFLPGTSSRRNLDELRLVILTEGVRGASSRREIACACAILVSGISRDQEIEWWSRRDLNPRPLRCERSALPAELLPHRGKKFYAEMTVFELGPQPISQFRPFQAEADLRRSEADAVAQVVARALELVTVILRRCESASKPSVSWISPPAPGLPSASSSKIPASGRSVP